MKVDEIPGGKLTIVGIIGLAVFVIGSFFLVKWLFKSEVVITDANGNKTKLGDIETSFSNPFASKEKPSTTTTTTQPAATTTPTA